MLYIPCNAGYTAKFTPRDINVWCSRIFLGDGDGFGIVYYQDVDSIVYWANEAAYRWGLRGFALWSLGQEDLRLWDCLLYTSYPASRRNYTISAQIGSNNLSKGTNGQVGIEVVFEYEDGTTETRFIDLY